MSSNRPLVSFIIPTYNSEHFLKKCLASIFSQETQIKFECIIIDCGSQDNTCTIAQEFKTVLLSSPKKSAAAARNVGLKNAQSKYVALVDSDVVLEKNWLSSCLQALESSHFIACQAPVVPQGDNPIDKFRRLNSRLSTFDTYIHLKRVFPPKVTMNTAACLMNREAISENTFCETLLKLEDSDFFTHLSAQGFHFCSVSNTKAHVYSNLTRRAYLKRAYSLGLCSIAFEKKWKLTPKRFELLSFKHFYFFSLLVEMAILLGRAKGRLLPSMKLDPAISISKSKSKFIFKSDNDVGIVTPFSRLIWNTAELIVFNPLDHKMQTIECRYEGNNVFRIDQASFVRLSEDKLIKAV